MALRPGERFGRYELAELLGRGGMGEVYSAYDSILHRKVALKVLTAPVGSAGGTDPPASGGGRILREARAAAGITHPNAVSIYDVGEVEGVPFLAMELVPGRTLRAFVGDTAIPLGRRIRWITDVARALGAAHQLGLVHRDIKPENVMVRDDGLVKVLDFGIARRGIGKREEAIPPNLDDLAVLGMFAVTNGTLTAEGMIVGTPMYMAPEQMRGEALDGRTDQFAWGVLAYEVLTGKIPWAGEGVAMLAQVLSREALPLTNTSREVPSPVDAIVRKALSKAPADRFATMEALADELEPFATNATTTGRRVSIPVRDMELAATEQLSISPEDVRRLQSGAQALTQGQTGTRARWGGRSGVALGAVVGAIAVAGVVGVRAGGAKRGGGGVVADAGGAAVDVPSQMSSNPDATAAYRAGLQGLRDGSMSAATKQLGRAIELDPLFGAAQLRLALTNALDAPTITSNDLQGAHSAQASLGTRDKILLDTFELIARVPPDFKASERLLAAATEKYPTDGDFPFELAVVLEGDSKPREAAKSEDVSIARDPTFAFARWLKATTLLELDDVAGATRELDRCLETSAGSTTCLRDLMKIQTNVGQCSDLVGTSRRLISLMPDGPEPYEELAQGLYGSGEPIDAVRAALQQARDRLPAADQTYFRTVTEASLAVVVGNFLGAERGYEECRQLSAARVDDDMTFSFVYPRVLIALEIGRLAEVRRLSELYLRERAGLSTIHYDNSLTMMVAKLAAGEITRVKFDEARDVWLTRSAEGDPSLRSINAYALPTSTREEALAALAKEPDARPLVRLSFLTPSLAEPIGRTYVLAGKLDEGIAYLTTAGKSCDQLNGTEAIFSQRASLELGRALERRADAAGACGAYRTVLARWGKASPASKTAGEALKRLLALGCTP